MTQAAYDLAIIGGGLGGAALAFAMARHGAKVLVAERDERFRDRIRGEGMTPWGAAEAQALGIYDLLRDRCAVEVRYFDTHFGPACMRRDLIETTPQRAPALDFYHPEMQEVVLQAASEAGAEVRRGVTVTSVTGNAENGAARLTLSTGDRTEEVSARLIVGADGRGSHVRAWGGFATVQDPHRLFVGGVLLEGASSPPEAISLIQGVGRASIFYPQRGGRVRVYSVYHHEVHGERLSGPSDLPQFLQSVLMSGAPAAWLADVHAVGPLATFEGADSWVPHPYRDGIALIGDAAAASDPSWGQGLSLTLRDVRTLSDKLRSHADWDAAGHAYADEHDTYYATLRAVEDWNTKLFMEVGAAADARRGKVLPLVMEDPTRVPDVLISGPMGPLGDEARIRFIGE